MWVKICGITRADDAIAALDAGADWIGLNFVGGPRRIGPEAAERIIAAIGGGEPVVALLRVDSSGQVALDDVPGAASVAVAESMSRLLAMGVRHVQVYGEAPASAWASIRLMGAFTLLAFPATGPGFAAELRARLAVIGTKHVGAVLLDSAIGGALGGTGRVADWQSIADAKAAGALDSCPPIVLAGGLTPSNVATAVRVVRPSGVDVSSGVEKQVGVKDYDRIREFVEAARRAEAS